MQCQLGLLSSPSPHLFPVLSARYPVLDLRPEALLLDRRLGRLVIAAVQGMVVPYVAPPHMMKLQAVLPGA